MKDILQAYFDEIATIPLLTREQEVEFGKRSIAGDQKAKDLIINANLRLVVAIAKNYKNMGLPFLDLISEGNIGLMMAVDRFDPNKFKNKFSTHASWWIRKNIRKALLDKSRIVRLPAHIGRRMNHILTAQAELENTLGRAPKTTEIAKKIGASNASVKSLFDFNSSYSLESMAEGGYDIASESRENDVYESAERSDLIERMHEVIFKLSETEQKILSWRFRLNGEEVLTLAQIGKKIGLSGERVRQMLEEIISKLDRLMKD